MGADHVTSQDRARCPWVRKASIGVALAMLSVLAACVSGPTPYGPAVDGSYGYGYKEQRLETNRYRVSFSGNSQTQREQVENYLLYRAAELTLESGNDYFVIARQDTERKERIVTSVNQPFFDPYPYNLYGGFWRGSRLYYGVDSYRLVERYEAAAVIKVFKGEPEEDDVSAYNARDVIKTLEPLIARPQTRSTG